MASATVSYMEAVEKQMIRPIQGPDLEMGFYCHNRTETAALDDLVNTLLDLGAAPAGRAYACDRDVYNTRPFGGYLDLPLSSLNVTDSADLRRLLHAEPQQLLSVDILGASDCVYYEAEHVHLARISDYASRQDKHPVMIDASGDKINLFFDPYATRSDRARAEKLGKKVFYRFADIVARVLPAYAAITIEEDICCPVDLEINPNPVLFKDFYVSESFVGTSALETIDSIFGGASSVPMGDGRYFSSTGFFSPGRCTSRDPDQSNYAKSEAVSRIIAYAGANWRRCTYQSSE